jgi:hypothetical protein
MSQQIIWTNWCSIELLKDVSMKGKELYKGNRKPSQVVHLQKRTSVNVYLNTSSH